MVREYFKLIPAVYLVLIKDGKILLIRRYQTGYEDGNYSMVAGHVEQGETMRQALVREAMEEAGVGVKQEDLRLLLTMHRVAEQGNERVDIFFATDIWEGEPKNMEPQKCDEMKWFELSDLPKNTIPYIRKSIECFKGGTRYCEFGWPEG
jgi:8-oxo-dGTP diphosphatase